MDKNRAHRLVIAFITVACIGLTAESMMMGWEFWILPIFIIGTTALWVMHISQRTDDRYRENFYLLYGLFAAFFHGVHETSFFDVAVVLLLMLSVYSLLDRIYMLNIILAEYFLLIGVQIVLALRSGSVTFDPLNISRIVLHTAVVVGVYTLCRVNIGNRLATAKVLSEHEQEINSYEEDMEDFLSNISHELRTPINVVNGMSELLIKNGAGEGAEIVKKAGLRLSCQVEDIQDYTEAKRAHMILEEEDYMTTSLINDVVSGYRHYDNADELELVVDMDTRVPAVMHGDVGKLRKIFRHLLDNAVKFTRRGGILIRMYAVPKDYGVNLCIEVTDTGCGMTRRDIVGVTKGLYQANKKRNRSTGGIGLGLSVVYGLVHTMDGFVKIESAKGRGTKVRVTVPQKVVDNTPCLKLGSTINGDILFHVRSEKYRVPQVREFYRGMAIHLAMGLNCPLYSAESVNEVEMLLGKMNVTHIFMGQEEYEENPKYFDKLSRSGVIVTVSARAGFRPNPDGGVIVMPKPLYGIPVARVLNEGKNVRIEIAEHRGKPVFSGVRALVVDDEPMNLVVARGLLEDHKMLTDTAESGKEAIEKFRTKDYDVVFMDHMMPEMDGVEAMKRLRETAREKGKTARIVALTANAVSGAKEMFLREGFDGFIAKPVDVSEFEHVLERVLPESMVTYEGGDAT
ncbi:MAG: response regulator [Oscillospiraceae bacterium]|nr:response regulator [Oscillospiraceae bacterium]